MFNRTASASTNAARRRNIPKALPLGQPLQPIFRRTSTLPQSPLKEGLAITQPLVSPSFALSPIPVTPGYRSQRLENLTHCLRAKAPFEAIYMSFGQAGDEAKHISTFLDLYRVRAENDACLRSVKSPTSREAPETWAAFEDITRDIPAPRTKSVSARRSRTSEHLRLAVVMEDVQERESETTQPESATAHDRSTKNTKPAVVTSTDATAPTPAPVQQRRQGPRTRVRPRLAPIPPPTAPLPSPPLPSPPLPSALLKVKSPLPAAVAPRRLPQPPTRVRPHPRSIRIVASPRAFHTPLRSPLPQAPYWVRNSRTPKTPRTMRSERRQGWGGMWDVGGMGQAVSLLKEG